MGVKQSAQGHVGSRAWHQDAVDISGSTASEVPNDPTLRQAPLNVIGTRSGIGLNPGNGRRWSCGEQRLSAKRCSYRAETAAVECAGDATSIRLGTAGRVEALFPSGWAGDGMRLGRSGTSA